MIREKHLFVEDDILVEWVKNKGGNVMPYGQPKRDGSGKGKRANRLRNPNCK